MIDRKQLQGIASDAPELVLEILADFATDGQERLAFAEQALEEGKLEEAGQAYHQLIGSSGTLGLSKLCEELRRLETSCKAGQRVIFSMNLTDLLLESVAEAKTFLIK